MYADWVDACDAVAKEDGEEGGVHAPARAPAAGRLSAGRREAEDEGDLDDLIDDEDDDGLGYGRDADGVAVDDEY